MHHLAGHTGATNYAVVVPKTPKAVVQLRYFGHGKKVASCGGRECPLATEQQRGWEVLPARTSTSASGAKPNNKKRGGAPGGVTAELARQAQSRASWGSQKGRLPQSTPRARRHPGGRPTR